MKRAKLPLIYLVLASVASVPVWFQAHAAARPGPRVIEISARRFGFTPREITLKKGEPVTLRLSTEDVKHGFFVKALSLDADIIPGTTAEITFTPQTTGKFVSVCDNFCGSGHGDMRMTIVVE
jgi:cytochrome c oxidase subunit 2